jgi:hypothetical protein
MFDGAEQNLDKNLTQEIQETRGLGREYAKALLYAEPKLADIKPDQDRAVGFDVGTGVDAIAFQKLGFTKAMITNSPSAGYMFALPQAARREQAIARAVMGDFPKDTYISSLEITDILKLSINPRLVTMLKNRTALF